jgi:DNA-binding CsgD family transcriptional regulator
MDFLKSKGPYRCMSLDMDHDDYNSPWLERLTVPENGPGDEARSDWLSDDELCGLVTELFTIQASEQTLHEYQQLLRHQLEGHSLQETADALGKTYNATKALRQRLILKLAEHYDVPPTWSAVAAKLRRDADLEGTLLAISKTLPPDRTVKYKAAILRLLMRGYDTAAIAVELGRTEEGIKGARRDLKRHLTAHCQSLGIRPPSYNRNGGGWRPAHHYAAMGGR